MKVYVAGPMRGIPEFNFPAFNAAADVLREEGHTVFNPAERDNERHGKDISKGNATGDEAVATEQHGFNLREALADDMAFITREADAIYMLAGWSKSRGACAERATAQALGLEVWYANDAEHIDAPNAQPHSKATTVNPKDLFGSLKVSLSKLPPVAVAHGAHAMMDGAEKYGPYNWRDKPVVAGIYVDAARRHIDNWFEGQKQATDSEVHHLGHAIACCAILLDAEANGVLLDDRPVFNNPDVLDRVYAEISATVKRRKAAKAAA